MALRRWKPFLGAFQSIDAAIEASDDDGVCRDEFRRARGRIVEMLCECDAAADGEKAEGLCLLLDEVMAESLTTLRAVPAERIAPRVLASGDLVGAVGALMRGHCSGRIRELARDVVSGWRAGVKAELARARAAMDVLDGLSSTRPSAPQDDTAPASRKEAKIPEEQPRPKKKTVVSSHRVSTAESYVRDPIVSTGNAKPSANKEAPTTVAPAQPKKTALPVVVNAAEEEKRMDATKRKLHERYQEAEDAKRRRTIQVIKPPRPPAVRARGPASCAAERRRFMKPSSLRMRV